MPHLGTEGDSIRGSGIGRSEYGRREETKRRLENPQTGRTYRSLIAVYVLDIHRMGHQQVERKEEADPVRYRAQRIICFPRVCINKGCCNQP